MGTLRDFVDLAKSFKGDLKDIGDDIYNATGKKKYSSIATRAAEGILQFPIIISNSIDIDTAQMVVKALEREYATFAQIVFSMSPTLQYSDDVSTVDYLRKFHQNQPRMFEFIYRESIDYNILENDDYVVLGATYESGTQKITAQNREQLIDLMESLRHDILNNKYIPRDTTLYNFSDKETNGIYNSILKEAKDLDERKYNWQQRQDNIRNRREDDKFGYQQRQDNIRNRREDDKFAYQKQHDKISSRSIDLSRDMLKDNDVKKANELIATTLHLRVRLVNKNDEDMGIVDFLVGIKGIMHPVKSTEMISNMVSACQNNDKIFNFLRWTTGEISFFKDFLFNIKEMKKDIYDSSKGASPWWIALKRRKEMAKFNNVFNKGNILPNATIVMSAEEVELIKTEYGFDLYNSIFVNKIMRQYFLLGFVIVDSSSQIVNFAFDGDSDFQTVSFSGLEKAGSNDEKKFKEMLKTINRI